MSLWPWIIGFNTLGAAATGALAAVSIAPRNQFWGKVYTRGSCDKSQFALTFDDGPDPASTPQILDILAELKANATFFVIGRYAEQYPDLIQRIHREGHLICNHSWDHSRRSMFRGTAHWRDQLARTNAIIEDTIKMTPAFFRPPFGVKTYFVMKAAREMGFATITWSKRWRDGVTTTRQRILSRLENSTGGDVLLLHDGVEPGMARDAMQTVTAVKPLILRLRDRGLVCTRLDELLGLPPWVTPAARATGVSAPA